LKSIILLVYFIIIVSRFIIKPIRTTIAELALFSRMPNLTAFFSEWEKEWEGYSRK